MNKCTQVVCGGGRSRWKEVRGCAAVMTPFFQASRRSLADQFTLNASLMCPPFSILRKILHFQPCFGQNFSSQDANFPNFCSQDPLIFQEIHFVDPTFGNLCGTYQKKKKKLSALLLPLPLGLCDLVLKKYTITYGLLVKCL